MPTTATDPIRVPGAAGATSALATLEFLRSLHFTMLEEYGDETQDALYRTGFEWGLRDLAAQTSRPPESAAQALRRWWTTLAGAGWGTAEFDASLLAQGVVVAAVKESAVAAALGGSDDPVCHLYAGLLAGAFSYLARDERHAVEIACQALGDERCLFVIAPGPLADSAENWRQQGLRPGEILNRVRQP